MLLMMLVGIAIAMAIVFIVVEKQYKIDQEYLDDWSDDE